MLAFFSKTLKKEIDDLARSMADDLIKSYSIEIARSKQDKKHRRILGKALDAVYARAQAFHRERRLGVYGRARLGNGFQWALKEQGYPEEFVQEATKGLLLALQSR